MYRDETKNLNRIYCPDLHNRMSMQYVTFVKNELIESQHTCDFFEINLDSMIQFSYRSSDYWMINIPFYYDNPDTSKSYTVSLKIPADYNSKGYMVDISGYLVLADITNPNRIYLTQGIFHTTYDNLAVAPSVYNDYNALWMLDYISNYTSYNFNLLVGHLTLSLSV